MPKIGDATFDGISGRGYRFEVHSMGTDFKAVGGVYAITRRSKNAENGHTHQAIYIGQTQDLSTRFDDHHKANCFETYGANCICTHLDDKESSRLTKENDLIRRHNPLCND